MRALTPLRPSIASWWGDRKPNLGSLLRPRPHPARLWRYGNGAPEQGALCEPVPSEGVRVTPPGGVSHRAAQFGTRE